jgi:A/G-specific adenine glycosylase
MTMVDGTFAQALVAWQRRAGRHDLPWQRTDDPYRIWVSEVMLQQTQVATVLGYYVRFLERFPTLQALADAPVDEVLRHWSGLGYYSRARNLHRCARELALHQGGRFPCEPVALAGLPGIGRSTAAAIAAFAFGARAAILDGNVKRVLCRAFGIEGVPSERAVESMLWQVAEGQLPASAEDMVPYTQGLMDLGATVCTRARPRCNACPVSGRCVALASGRVAQLPTPRAARVVAVRRSELLLAVRDGRVLLERRPASGIWGGLQSLPEFSPPQLAASHRPPQQVAGELADWVRLRLGEGWGAASVHGELRHAFTHFRLRARIWRVDAGEGVAPMAIGPGATEPGAAEPGTFDQRDGDTWMALEEVPQAALPRPIKTLLAGLRDGSVDVR